MLLTLGYIDINDPNVAEAVLNYTKEGFNEDSLYSQPADVTKFNKQTPLYTNQLTFSSRPDSNSTTSLEVTETKVAPSQTESNDLFDYDSMTDVEKFIAAN